MINGTWISFQPFEFGWIPHRRRYKCMVDFLLYRLMYEAVRYKTFEWVTVSIFVRLHGNKKSYDMIVTNHMQQAGHLHKCHYHEIIRWSQNVKALTISYKEHSQYWSDHKSSFYPLGPFFIANTDDLIIWYIL